MIYCTRRTRTWTIEDIHIDWNTTLGNKQHHTRGDKMRVGPDRPSRNGFRDTIEVGCNNADPKSTTSATLNVMCNVNPSHPISRLWKPRRSVGVASSAASTPARHATLERQDKYNFEADCTLGFTLDLNVYLCVLTCLLRGLILFNPGFNVCGMDSLVKRLNEVTSCSIILESVCSVKNSHL